MAPAVRARACFASVDNRHPADFSRWKMMVGTRGRRRWIGHLARQISHLTPHQPPGWSSCGLRPARLHRNLAC
jgi:hypothetical protein